MKIFGKDAPKSKPQRSTHGEQLAKALNWIITDDMFAEVALHGNIDWIVVHLVRVAILWVWSDKRELVVSANDAIKKTAELFGTSGIKSYQTLINVLKKYSGKILPLLQRRKRQLMEETDSAKFRIGMWLALAVDGSRLDAPRTHANERQFCKPQNKKNKKQSKKNKKRGRHAKARQPVSKKSHYNPQPVGPQVWLTLMWHIGMRMPWAWEIGPSYSSERAHFLAMLETMEFPENTLFCGDAGFVGYDFWNAIHVSNHRFLCRVGSNCRFLKKLGRVRERDGIVYCWPQDKQRQGVPPLVMRLLRFNDGRGEVYLVTNELNPRKLSDSLAGKIYRQRWGIEVQFRSLKQTYHRSKLRGRTPEVVVLELSWSLVGLWMAQLLALKEQTDVLEPDAQTSIAQVLRILQEILQRPDVVPILGATYHDRMAEATTDTYQRKRPKKSRNYPRRKEEPRTGPPQVTLATAAHKKLDRQIQSLQNPA